MGIFLRVPTKSGLKKAIKRGSVLVNGQATSTAYFVQKGDCIELYQSIQNSKKVFKKDLKIWFEDDYLAVIEKPPGIVVSGNQFATIANCLAQNLQPSTQTLATTPYPVHRLDYPTSGLLLVGKTTEMIQQLNQLFAKKEIQKTYAAITIGKMPKNGTLSTPIGNKTATTDFNVIKSVYSEKFDQLNLVKLFPKTGRKHQLRIHLHKLGNPILGDKQYFHEGKVLKGYGLYLHAIGLEFNHPITQEKFSIRSTFPKRFQRIIPESEVLFFKE